MNLTTDSGLLDYLAGEFTRYREKGFKAFKMKVGGGSLKLDFEWVRLAREVIGEESDLMIDANNLWDALTAIPMARKFEPYDIK